MNTSSAVLPRAAAPGGSSRARWKTLLARGVVSLAERSSHFRRVRKQLPHIIAVVSLPQPQPRRQRTAPAARARCGPRTESNSRLSISGRPGHRWWLGRMIVTFIRPRLLLSRRALAGPLSLAVPLIGLLRERLIDQHVRRNFTPYVHTVEQKMKCPQRPANARTSLAACSALKQIMSMTTSNAGRPFPCSNASNCFAVAGNVLDAGPAACRAADRGCTWSPPPATQQVLHDARADQTRAAEDEDVHSRGL